MQALAILLPTRNDWLHFNEGPRKYYTGASDSEGRAPTRARALLAAAGPRETLKPLQKQSPRSPRLS
eukprot:1854005-Pleurochrysis_carterae.AAC.3